MKIGELSRETYVSVRLLRYYEAQGLLTSRRSEGGHRHYGSDAPVTVARIRTLLAELDSRIAELGQARTALGEILEASTRALAVA
jgi:DNA-binding transcriptional MerR regulator